MGEPKAMRDHESIKEHGREGGTELLWDRYAGSSFKKAGNCLLACYLCEGLTGCVVYLLLITRFKHVLECGDTFPLFKKKRSCLLFFVLKFGLIMERIEKNTAEVPFHTVFFSMDDKDVTGI